MVVPQREQPAINTHDAAALRFCCVAYASMMLACDWLSAVHLLKASCVKHMFVQRLLSTQ